MQAETESQDFSKYLRRLRRDLSILLRELAEIAGVSPSYLSRIENGMVPASTGILKAIADGLKISRAELLERAGRIVNKGVTKEDWQYFRMKIDEGEIDIR